MQGIFRFLNNLGFLGFGVCLILNPPPLPGFGTSNDTHATGGNSVVTYMWHLDNYIEGPEKMFENRWLKVIQSGLI